MKSSPQLRDYQQSMLQDLYKAWKRTQSVMVQMPTGTGKTYLMAAVIREYADKGVLVVAHRRELIAQISQTLDGFEVEHGLIVSGQKIDFSEKVQVASIQTLKRRMDDVNGPRPKKCGRPSAEDKKALLSTFDFSLVIIDEAHHALADTYQMLWDKWPDARFLGLTATPCRLNHAPFTDLFQKLLQSWSIQKFIDKGWLSDFDYVSASPNSEAMKQVRKLRKRGADGDYQIAELALVMDVPESIAHLYKTYKQFADGKKGIVYAIDCKHAQHITEYYVAQGVSCCMIDGKTPAAERKQLIDGYLTGKISVLISIDCFSEGFDAPEVEFIQLARPTLSLSKYLQQVGRGMRVSPGKPHVQILDQVGLYQTFGLPTEERDWRMTFDGLGSGKGMTDSNRMVILDENGQEKDLVNLEMVRIKKGGKRHTGLEIFLKDGKYGVRNNGKISCEARFKEIVKLQQDPEGFFAAGIYGDREYGDYVERASLIDRRGIDWHLRLYRDVYWENGVYYSRYLPRGYKKGDYYWSVFWDPKGNCYYDYDPEFQMVAGMEVARAYEHNDQLICHKFRYTTGNLSPRFDLRDMYFNKHIVIARDYLVVKNDKNHAYHICGFWNNSIIVQNDDMSGYLQILADGKKGEMFKSLPHGIQKVSPISYIYYMRDLKLRSVWREHPSYLNWI